MSDNLPVNLNEVIREKIKSVLFESITDEQLNAFIHKEFVRFTTDQKTSYGADVRSDLAAMVQDNIKKLYVDKIQSFVAAEFAELWDNNKMTYVGNLVKEMTPIIVDTYQTRLVQQVIEGLKSSIQHSGY
jgi:hypothetical protein